VKKRIIGMFVGILMISSTGFASGGLSEVIYGNNKNYWQVGAMAVQNIGSKTKVYEQVAMGKDRTSLEGGVSYPVVRNVEFNVIIAI